MRAGSLDRRITVERATLTKNAFNEDVRSWGAPIEVWAAKLEIPDGEAFSAGEVSARITTRFQVRYSTETAQIDERDRIVYDGKPYDIVRVKEIGRREGFEITATARAED